MSKIQANQIQHTQNGAAVFTLPTSDGSAGQVLTTNGSGVLSWTNDKGKILQVANTTLNTRGTLSITNQYANNSSNIYYVTGIDTTVTTTQANSKLLISGSLSGEFSNREDFFGYVLSSTISGTTAPIDALRATSGGKTNRPRYTFVPSISYNATNNDSTPNTTPFSNYLYAPAQASGTAITIRLGVACHTGGSETLYINQTVNTSTDHSDYEHMISHMTVMEVAA